MSINRWFSTAHTNTPNAVGAYQVISGWEEGLKGMCQGEKRTLTIPSTMAYGTLRRVTTYSEQNLKVVQARAASAASSLPTPPSSSMLSSSSLSPRARTRSFELAMLAQLCVRSAYLTSYTCTWLLLFSDRRL